MTSARLSCLMAFLLAMAFAKGQDPNFAGVQEMNIWYNPALKINKVPNAHVSIRSVKYPNIISYSSKAATIELPLINRERNEEDNTFFMNLAAGISTDNSANNYMNVSSAMLALSYALPLNDDNTYIAIGFQGAYTFNRVGIDGSFHFPEEFDKYGAIATAITADPLQSGFNYGYFSAGAGVAVFQTLENRQWYIGGSVRHFNQPYTEWTHSARLNSNYSVQAAYNTFVSSSDAIGCYGTITSQNKIREQIIGARYTRNLDDSANYSVSFGTACRVGDALMPSVQLKAKRNRFGFYYEINTQGSSSNNYHRRTLEFCYWREL